MVNVVHMGPEEGDWVLILSALIFRFFIYVNT